MHGRAQPFVGVRLLPGLQLGTPVQGVFPFGLPLDVFFFKFALQLLREVLYNDSLALVLI